LAYTVFVLETILSIRCTIRAKFVIEFIERTQTNCFLISLPLACNHHLFIIFMNSSNNILHNCFILTLNWIISLCSMKTYGPNTLFFIFHFEPIISLILRFILIKHIFNFKSISLAKSWNKVRKTSSKSYMGLCWILIIEFWIKVFRTKI